MAACAAGVRSASTATAKAAAHQRVTRPPSLRDTNQSRVRGPPLPLPSGRVATEAEDVVTMDKIVALCKRRGFLFQSSEIYGGLGVAYAYRECGGPLKA